MSISVGKMANAISVSQARISGIIMGKIRITADTALRLSIYFGTSPRFWLGLQHDFDLEEVRNYENSRLRNIRHWSLTDND